VLTALPQADILIADRGYDSDWFREALAGGGIETCIPGPRNHKRPVECDTVRYKQRNLVKRMFGRLYD
jgi:transposase